MFDNDNFKSQLLLTLGLKVDLVLTISKNLMVTKDAIL